MINVFLAKTQEKVSRKDAKALKEFLAKAQRRRKKFLAKTQRR
jgi:hypothetical protein